MKVAISDADVTKCKEIRLMLVKAMGRNVQVPLKSIGYVIFPLIPFVTCINKSVMINQVFLMLCDKLEHGIDDLTYDETLFLISVRECEYEPNNVRFQVES